MVLRGKNIVNGNKIPQFLPAMCALCTNAPLATLVASLLHIWEWKKMKAQIDRWHHMREQRSVRDMWAELGLGGPWERCRKVTRRGLSVGGHSRKRSGRRSGIQRQETRWS